MADCKRSYRFHVTNVLLAALLLLWAVAGASSVASAATTRDALYKDPSQPISKRVSDLLDRMTLDEKIGQMLQIGIRDYSPEVMVNYSIGSVATSISDNNQTSTPKQWVDMVNTIQNASLSSRLKIPMIYGIDAVHGHNTVVGATIFPHNVGLGATRDPDLVRKIGAATALEVRATGIPYVFVPCIAVCRNPRWGRCYESYSEDPAVVKNMTSIIYGLQGQPPANATKGLPFLANQSNVVACAKHYVGDGGTTNGTDRGNTVLDFRNLTRIHMTPYFGAIYKSVSTIMISYSSWNGQKMHANHTLISNVLKDTYKFKGFTISDYLGIDEINTNNYSQSVLESINAGIDMVMEPFKFRNFTATLQSLVESGAVNLNRIDDAVRRILRVKFTMGLFEHPFADYSFVHQLGSQEHRDLARAAVRKSLVLLKNGKSGEEPLLPLDKKAPKILVAGTHANSIGYQCGGWTIEWQGSSKNLTNGTTILSGIISTVSNNTQVVYEENPDPSYVKNQGFSYAVVVVGEAPYAETRGDNDTLVIPLGGDDIVKNVCSTVKCVVVLVSGRPLVIEHLLSVTDAFVAAWLPGSEGKGVADVLYGDYPFTGKLPRTWFKTVDQLPMNVGDEHYDPLFPFGFGLAT